jgi:uncharacterized protein (TIGR02284 family)
MSNHQLITSLNDLLEYLNDSYRGYQECAENVSSKKLADLFRSLSTKRQRMAQELAEKLHALGAAPKEGGSITGAAHRLFVHLKSILTGEDNDAIIQEIKRGENTAIERYKEVLKEKALPADLQALLMPQLHEFEKDLMTIDELSVANY